MCIRDSPKGATVPKAQKTSRGMGREKRQQSPTTLHACQTPTHRAQQPSARLPRLKASGDPAVRATHAPGHAQQRVRGKATPWV
eukprot:14520201-Alexandrium_andersonii.AAC.1